MITNLQELNDTISAVVTRALEKAAQSAAGPYTLTYPNDLADLISVADYHTYFDFIAHELMGREEVKDLVVGNDCLHIVYDVSRDKAQASAPIHSPSKGTEHLGSSHKRSHIAEAPVTSQHYEDLIIEAEMQREDMRHGAAKDKRPLAFQVCTNVYGQMDDPLLSHFPKARATFANLFSEASPTSTYRYGAMISGHPALILNHEIASLGDDSNLNHARTAMMVGQLRSIFADSGVHFTYGRGTGNQGGNEIMAILPADADPKKIREFDRRFAKALKDLTLSTDPAWVKKQYDAFSSEIASTLPRTQSVAPWTKKRPDVSAVYACELLGKYMGAHHDSWLQSVQTGNTAKLDRLASKVDASSSMVLRSAFAGEGIRMADEDLSRSITLYTSDHPPETFTLTKGQLALALEQMDYEQTYTPFEFMLGYPPEAANEIKRLVQKMPKRSLEQTVANARKRKEEHIDHSHHMREQDKGRDL